MTKSRAKKLASLITAVITLLLGYYLNKNPQVFNMAQPVPTGMYKVVRFADGDTLDVDSNGKTDAIRFMGVDNTETNNPRNVVQCLGQAAGAYTNNLIASTQARLDAEPLGTKIDNYTR